MEVGGDIGFAGIDHLHMEQLVRVQNGVLRFINGS